jgi:predicted ATPase/class 3 adenylate cyclase
MMAIRDLPSGTVTFLFTDIEGSTRLLQDLGDRYAELLDDHCRLIRHAVAAEDGTEVGTEGDSFFVAFADAARALSAAVSAQRALEAQAWPDGAQVRVRMGLHTGEGKRGGGNYIGLDVNRAARIAAAGHGGQVLLSKATAELVSRSLPRGVRLGDLGPHRLKDLAQPEHLYQAEIEGLPTEFPPLRTLDARPNNLPAQLTSFVGREADLAAVGDLLERARLVTLTGPGGTGKTRLATQVAAERLSRYADGAYLVELAAITDPELVPSAIAEALGIRESTEHALSETLVTALRDREMLLLLDNFEQVIEGAPLVTQLLEGAPRLRVLATSRAVLHVHGEHEYLVPTLAIPDASALPSLAALSQFEGVSLFVERATASRPGFTITNESAPAVAEIVARLDGLPLAIELAAANVRLLSPQAILGRLGSRLAFLGSGPRDLPARQRTLRDAIDWSHELLKPEEQVLFRRLAVFIGGWTVDAAEAVCSPSEVGLDAFGGLATILDQSLIRGGAEGAGGEPRFMMLETIREFASAKLAEAGDADLLRRRHAEHYLRVAEETEPELTRSPDAIERIATDHDNFRASLGWAIETDSAELALRLVFALWRFWHQRAHLREGREWAERALALPGAEARTGARARGLTGAAGVAYWQNDYEAAEAWYVEAESIFRELEDQRGLSDALYNVASMAAIGGRMEEAMSGMVESADLARLVGDDALAARSLAAIGYGAFMQDDLETARTVLDEGLELAKRTGDQYMTGGAHHTVAQVARLQGRLADAAEHYRAAIRIMQQLGDQASLSEPLQGLAAVEVASGQLERGVRLLAASAAVRERLGGGPPPEWLRLGDPLAEARKSLSESAYRQAWEAGGAMSIDDAVAEAEVEGPGG